MKILRFEYKNKGVFRSESRDLLREARDEYRSRHRKHPINDPHHHPTPFRDLWIEDDYFLYQKWGSNAFFGCESKKTLNEWFSPFFRRFLFENGAVVCIYEVEEKYVAKSLRQVAFLKKHAKRIEMIISVEQYQNYSL